MPNNDDDDELRIYDSLNLRRPQMRVLELKMTSRQCLTLSVTFLRKVNSL